MKIWDSVPLMTVFDLVILAMAAVGAWSVWRLGRRFPRIGSVGPVVVSVGLVVLAGFFLLDLGTMWVLPGVIGGPAATAVMEKLHLDWVWVTMLFAAMALGIGLLLTGRGLERIEREQMQREAKHRALFESSIDGIATFENARIVDCNDRLLEILGRNKEELIGKSPWEFSPEVQSDGRPSKEKAWEIVARLRGGEPTLFEWRFLMRDGTTLDSEIAMSPVEGQQGSVGHLRDITERKAIESALRASEKQYRDVFNVTTSGLVIRRLSDGKLVDVNPALAEMHGYSVEELIKLPMEAYVPTASRELFHELLSDLRKGKKRNAAGQGLRKDGSSFDLEGFFVPFQYRGEPHLLGVLNDISERRRAEQVLRQSEERYRAVFETSSNGVMIRRLKDLSLVAANPAMARIFGYSAEEFEQLSPESYIHPDDLHRYTEMVETIDRGEVFRYASMRGIKKDRSQVEIAGYFTRFPHTQEPHVLGIVEDVTAARETERQKEEAFKEIERLRDELERERDYLREEVTVAGQFGDIVGRSATLQEVIARIEAVADTDAAVLIQGESGVGKELVARAIHSESPRSEGPLVKVNCASIPGELFESEFFGHSKGAFTGAHRERVGRFQLADGGTLFLDEVAEIPSGLQAKLLRVLQDGEFQRVGEEKTRIASVRVIAATNRNLKQETEKGHFREDLYYRLSVFPIDVPSLRERREDILPLAQHFLDIACKGFGRRKLRISEFQAFMLKRYGWPGNIRELRNVIEQAVILSRGDRLRLDQALPGAKPLARRPAANVSQIPEKSFLTAAELRERDKENLIAALEYASWKVSGSKGAAALLGIKPSTLRYQMKSFGISRPSSA